MKKLLFTMFYATVALLGLGIFSLSSESYAQAVGPKIDWNGNLFNWQVGSNTATYNAYYGTNTAMLAWQCGANSFENGLPKVGVNFNAPGPTGCVGLWVTPESPVDAYVPHPQTGVWYHVTFSPTGVVQSVEPATTTYTHKTTTSYGYPNTELRTVNPPLYQTGIPYFSICPNESLLDHYNTSSPHAVHFCVDGGAAVSTWHTFNTPTRCSPYKKGIVNYHDTTYGIDYHFGGAYSSTLPYQACVPEIEDEPIDLPAACGTSHGQTLSAAPTSNLCDFGNSASPISGTGPWTWSCTGSLGDVVQCSANIAAAPTNGICGIANNGSYSSAPTANLCDSGNPTAVAGNGPWSWSCNGSNGGDNASCSATRSTTPVNAVCGTSHGQATSAFPTAGLCSVGTPFITSVSPDGSNFFTWTCLGSDGGANASCNAPYVAMACVPYDPSPSGIHAGLSTNILPNDTNDVAVALNNTSFPNLTSSGGVIYTSSGSYSFTGAITSGQYLKVTINNLASAGQFVQLRSTQNNTAGPFYGCNASQWNYSHPLSWPYNQSLANVGIQASAGDPLWGFVNPITQDNGVSGFLAWFKPGKGFEVRCEVCALSTPVTTRSSACENLPAHAIANTTSTIVQNYIAGSWSPSTIFTYNTTPSTSECRFVCETGYNRNGSACVQTLTYSWDESPWGACTEPAGVCSGTYIFNDDTSNMCSGPCGVWQTLSCAGPTDEATCKNPQSLPRGYASYDGNTQDYENSCMWTPPNPAQGTQTRTVVCKDNNGNTVDDSLCPQPKPPLTQTANCSAPVTYDWDESPWSGACPSTQQTRTVVCKNNSGVIVADSFCSQPKPNTTQPLSCNTTCGGYSHVYARLINEEQTKDVTTPGECGFGDQWDREYTCSYNIYQDAAGTIPANVMNLNFYTINPGYPAQVYGQINGTSIQFACRADIQADYPPGACGVSEDWEAYMTNSSCVTIIN